MDMVQMAHMAASNSLDPSTKVGAVVVSAKGIRVYAGWNKFPVGIPPEYWEDRKLKYRHVIHAEFIAIACAGEDARDATMVVTHHPCRDCAKLMVAAGVGRAIFPARPWREDPDIQETCADARAILAAGGVEVMYSGSLQ